MNATTILNVDDAQVNRYIRTQVLLSAGYHVVEAGTGKEALERIAADRPQLVLLDMNLPDMHGTEVCRLIKSQPDATSVMVVHISATQTTVEDRVFGLEEGADGYLVEPVEPDLLLATVRSMLRLRQLEAQLEESLADTQNLAAKYQSLVEAVSHIIFTSSKDGDWTYVSEQFSGYVGLPKEEALKTGWLELLHQADRQRVAELWTHVLRTGEPFEVECRFRYKNFSYRWNTARARPVRIGGLISQWVGSVTDIHERRMLESEIKARHREFVALAEHSPDIISRLDPMLRYTYINSALPGFSSLSPEQHIGKTQRELGCDPEFCDRFEEACRAVQTTGLQNAFEFSHKMDKGNIGHYQARVVPEFDREGALESFLTIISDFTDRRNAEMAVVESERKLRRLVESNVIGVVIVAGDHITFANDVFLDTVGYSRKDLEDGTLDWRKITPPEYQPREERCAAELIEKGASSTFEKEYWRKDGSRAPVLIGLAALNHEATEFACFVIDMSQLKNAEAALKRTNLALRRSNEDLEQFAHASSHDLQEPLRTISLYAELLARQLKGTVPAQAIKSIETIQDAAGRMLRLIHAFLDFSQAQNAELSLSELVPAANLVKGAVENLKSAIEESGAIVCYENLPTILVDGVQFTAVFQNLIGNSIKYREASRSPRIDISANREGQSWVFAVRDNGMGFEQAHAEQIFGHFKRLHGQEVPGSGIGLAIVKRIVERHEGHIWAESKPGVGATFYFRLPVGAVDGQGG